MPKSTESEPLVPHRQTELLTGDNVEGINRGDLNISSTFDPINDYRIGQPLPLKGPLKNKSALLRYPGWPTFAKLSDLVYILLIITAINSLRYIYPACLHIISWIWDTDIFVTLSDQQQQLSDSDIFNNNNNSIPSSTSTSQSLYATIFLVSTRHPIAYGLIFVYLSTIGVFNIWRLIPNPHSYLETQDTDAQLGATPRPPPILWLSNWVLYTAAMIICDLCTYGLFEYPYIQSLYHHIASNNTSHIGFIQLLPVLAHISTNFIVLLLIALQFLVVSLLVINIDKLYAAQVWWRIYITNYQFKTHTFVVGTYDHSIDMNDVIYTNDGPVYTLDKRDQYQRYIYTQWKKQQIRQDRYDKQQQQRKDNNNNNTTTNDSASISSIDNTTQRRRHQIDDTTPKYDQGEKSTTLLPSVSNRMVTSSSPLSSPSLSSLSSSSIDSDSDSDTDNDTNTINTPTMIIDNNTTSLGSSLLCNRAEPTTKLPHRSFPIIPRVPCSILPPFIGPLSWPFAEIFKFYAQHAHFYTNTPNNYSTARQYI